MQTENDAREDGPEQDGYPPKNQHQHCQDYRWHPMVIVQPQIEAVACQIRRVLGHDPGVVVVGFAEQNPAHVRPPRAVAGGMRIAGQVRMLMVQAVHCYPKDRSTFERQGAAKSEEVLDQDRHLVRTMRVQAVIANADSQPGGHTIRDDGRCEDSPTEHEQRGERSDMKQNQDGCGEPVQALVLMDRVRIVQKGSKIYRYIAKLARLFRAVCKSY